MSRKSWGLSARGKANHQRSKAKAAFSIVELSVVLAIMGITLAGGLTVATQALENEKKNVTNTRLTAIRKAFAAYTLEEGNLPCPADLTLAFADSGFGIGDDSFTVCNPASDHPCAPNGQKCAHSNFDSGSDADPANRHVQAGAVPVATLNLPDDYAIDGWGRRFMYMVDVRFTMAGAAFKDTDPSALTTTQKPIEYRATAAGAAINSNEIYAVISFGKNGHGAYPRNGGSTRISASGDVADLNDTNYNDERKNCKCAWTTAAAATTPFDALFIDKTGTNTYDDIVLYQNKTQIITEAAGVTDSTTCDDATDAAASCTTANLTYTDECEALGRKVNAWCLQP